jgi:Na+-transporting NADH:ubiquinone oxidoreductase subunit A
MFIRIKNGLDIPIKGAACGLPVANGATKKAALNLKAFHDVRFKVLVKIGDRVKIGTPLAENKSIAGQMFVSPACGLVSEIRRGLKRALEAIVIDVEKDEFESIGSLNPSSSKEQILSHLLKGGVFPHIRMRPFDLVASTAYVPRDIFVTAHETLPFLPSAEMQVEGHEKEFQIGLDALSKLTNGKVHLGLKENSTAKAFTEAKNVQKYFISGPHPAANASLLIHFVKPIETANDYVWTLSTIDVIAVGMMMKEGRYYHKRIVAIGGNAIFENKRQFLETRAGAHLGELLQGRVAHKDSRLISGDPLTGTEANLEDFLGFYHTCVSMIPENHEREAFHFLGIGSNKYSATGAYLTGHLKPPPEGYDFTTNQHGEERPFVDSAIYEKVMPMRIPTMQLVKAVLAENFELAASLGLYEVAPADFALPSFICPSKIEMMDIIRRGLHIYSKDMGH